VHHAVSRVVVVLAVLPRGVMMPGMCVGAVSQPALGRVEYFIRTVIWIMSGMVSNLGFGGSMVMRFLPLIVQAIS